MAPSSPGDTLGKGRRRWHQEKSTNDPEPFCLSFHSCSAGPLPTPACNETDKQLIGSSHFCGLLTDTSGPFQVCHAVLSPSDYFDTCFYDLCELGLDRETLCKSLQSYADACQSLGVQIPAWRNATFCRKSTHGTTDWYAQENTGQDWKSELGNKSYSPYGL